MSQNQNQIVNLNTDYLLFSPTLAQLQNAFGSPISGCNNFDDASKLDSSFCNAFVGMVCNENLSNNDSPIPFVGVTNFSNAVSLQILIDVNTSNQPINDVTVYYTEIGSESPNVYGLMNIDGSYFCASTTSQSFSPAPIHLTTNDPPNVIFNPCGNNSGGTNMDKVWDISTTCTLPTSISAEGFVFIPVNPPSSTNQMKLGDLFRIYNPNSNQYLSIQNMTWGTSSSTQIGSFLPNDSIINQGSSQLVQIQYTLALVSTIPSPSSGFDGTIFQFLPTSGLLPQSFNVSSSLNTSLTPSTSCPCPLSQCPQQLCNVQDQLLFLDPQGNQLCPVNCLFNPLTASCSFQIDPGLCSLCADWQCGQCPNGYTCARDLNSGNCSCVPTQATVQDANNRLFWIYLLIGLLILAIIVGGGLMLWFYLSFLQKAKHPQSVKKKVKDQTIESTIFSIAESK